MPTAPILKSIALTAFFSVTALLPEGNPKKIVIIDTGVGEANHSYLCGEGHKDFTGTDLIDKIEHGSIVYSLITKDLPSEGYCVVIIKWMDTHSDKPEWDLFDRISTYVRTLNPAYINMSLSGVAYTRTEYRNLKAMTGLGTKVFVAAGNDGRDLSVDCDRFPACYNLDSNFYVVGSLDDYSNKLESSNYGLPVTKWASGIYKKPNGTRWTGTSFASPRALVRDIND